jgi:glycerate dehydrogenase
VAAIARAFGMETIAVQNHPGRDAGPGIRFVELATLFAESDVVSLHAPLTNDNAGIVNAELLGRMKPTSFLINTSRGALVNETDLKQALEAGCPAGAALDVLSAEPPPAGHPLLTTPNCLFTPHQAWATREARERLMDGAVENVAAYLHGTPINVVNQMSG